MQSTVRWCITTEDRIGMVRDIVAVLADMAANVEAMEVVARVLYVRFRCPKAAIDPMRQTVLRVRGVLHITDVERLPFEADEARLVQRLLQQDGTTLELSLANLTYTSDAMARVVRMATIAAKGDMPVLITGESGTGKELLARAVHSESPRRDRRFVPVNCAAIPDALMESEMFGYAEGAFTGALRGGHPGLFEVADGGTLFLDEIGELSPLIQAKLLRALADGEIRRVGGTETTRVNVRIVAATNRNLADMVRTGRFREDLLYRLNVMPIAIPPLRDRREDIPVLARQFVERMAVKLERKLTLSAAAEAALLRYDFPGNVRELQNILERACYLAEDGILGPEHLWLQGPSLSPGSQLVTKTGSLKERVRRFERAVIQQTLAETGSLRAAARRLGVTHTTLANKLRDGVEGNSDG